MKPRTGADSMSRRAIIVHFHFFKNAGTSIEHILRAHFGDRFATHEPGAPTETFPATVLLPYLQEHDQLQAVSSHTVCFPPPVHPDWAVFPMVFLRHPIDRILSMYNYERRQDSQNPGAVAAKERGLAGYVEATLDRPGEYTARNYQAWMLGQGETPEDDAALLRAAAGVVERLPVVGVVDRFEASVRRFTDWLSPHFPGLVMESVHQNRISPVGSRIEQRIATLRERIGDRLFRRLVDENALDLELYRLARRRLP